MIVELSTLSPDTPRRCATMQGTTLDIRCHGKQTVGSTDSRQPSGRCEVPGNRIAITPPSLLANGRFVAPCREMKTWLTTSDQRNYRFCPSRTAESLRQFAFKLLNQLIRYSAAEFTAFRIAAIRCLLYRNVRCLLYSNDTLTTV